jgi:hypothetical protein
MAVLLGFLLVGSENIGAAGDADAIVGPQGGPGGDLPVIEQQPPLLAPDHGRQLLTGQQPDLEAHRLVDILQGDVGQEVVADGGRREGELEVLFLLQRLQVEYPDLPFARRAFLFDDAFHGVEDDGGALRAVDGQQVAAHGGQLVGSGEELFNGIEKRVGGEKDRVLFSAGADLFIEDAGAADLFDLAGVQYLMVGRQVDLGHQDGRQPHGRDLLDSARSGAGDNQVGNFIDLGDVVEILAYQQPAFDLGRAAMELKDLHRVVVGLVYLAVGLAGGEDDEQVGQGEQARDDLGRGAVDGARPHAAAADEQHAAVGRDIVFLAALTVPGGKVDRPALGADGLAQRVARFNDLRRREERGGRGEGDPDAGGEAGDGEVEAPGDGVLLVDENAFLEQRRGEQHRGGGVAAAADDDVGLEAAQDEETFHRAQQDRSQGE